MKTDEMGYITDIAVHEAICLLNPLIYGTEIARGNGKSVLTTNRATAWCRIIEELSNLKNTIKANEEAWAIKEDSYKKQIKDLKNENSMLKVHIEGYKQGYELRRPEDL